MTMLNNSYTVKNIIDRMDLQYEADRCRHENLMVEISMIKALAQTTNGKVKLHQKLLWALGGAVFTLFIMCVSYFKTV